MASKKSKGLIYIMDMESTLAEALCRRILGMGQYCVFRKWDMQTNPEQEVEAYGDNIRGIILSGSSKNIHSKKAVPPSIPAAFLNAGVPILAICYGMQYLAYIRGVPVIRCWDEENIKKRKPKKDKGEQGPVMLDLTPAGQQSVLFQGLGPRFPVWMKHNWMVEGLPEGWTHTSSTNKCPIASMEFGNVFAIQFHPELQNSLFGKVVLHNFLSYACESDTPYF